MVEAVSNALGPWGTILGFFLTVAGLIVYFRKWLKAISGEQEQTRQFAQTAANAAGNAATSAGDAATSAGEATVHAKAAGNNSRQANEAIEWLATELARSNTARDYLADQNSTLFGALARERARQWPQRAEPDSSADATDEATVTGRHRLRPQTKQTTDEGEPA